MAEIKRGRLLRYSSDSHQATVLLAGSIDALPGLAVSLDIGAAEMVAGRQVAVLFFDLGNPSDAVVTAVWA